MTAITERAWQEQVTDLARLLGYRVYHPWTSIHSAAGWPDLVLCRPGRLVIAELKTGRRKVTPAQASWLELLDTVPGVEVYCWRPDDPGLEAIAQLLQTVA